MRVESAIPEFTPITLEITLESLQEVQNFYNIFNHSGILNSSGFDGGTIRYTLTKNHPNISDNFQPFADKLEAYYKRKLGL